jgi:hypothetical protein
LKPNCAFNPSVTFKIANSARVAFRPPINYILISIMSQEPCLDCAPACDLPQGSSIPPTVSTENVPALKSPGDAQEEDVTDPKTFTPPSLTVGPNIYVEYCDRVSYFALLRWPPNAILIRRYVTVPVVSISGLDTASNTHSFDLSESLSGHREQAGRRQSYS